MPVLCRGGSSYSDTRSWGVAMRVPSTPDPLYPPGVRGMTPVTAAAAGGVRAGTRPTVVATTGSTDTGWPLA